MSAMNFESHSHDHGHEEPHGHHGHHHHGPAHDLNDVGTIFLIGISLNILIVVLQVAAGLWGHSVASLADAGHNLSDVLGLGLAWGANHLSQRAPTPRYTYGLRASSILAALFNAVFLLVVTGALSFAAIQRFFQPEPVGGLTMIVVATVGMLVNGLTALLLASRRKEDLNVRGAFMHMLADAAVSAGVVVAGGLILLTGSLWLDPLASLAINAIIIIGTWELLRESLSMSLGAVPSTIKVHEVGTYLRTLPRSPICTICTSGR